MCLVTTNKSNIDTITMKYIEQVEMAQPSSHQSKAKIVTQIHQFLSKWL